MLLLCRLRFRCDCSFWPGIAAVCSAVGIAYCRLPHGLFVPIVFALVATLVTSLYGLPSAVIIIGLLGSTSVILLRTKDALYLAGSSLISTGMAFACVAVIKSFLRERHQESTMFEQARWAASELADANMRLQDYTTESQVLTQHRERTRVAREIHDTVGYTLTAVLVQVIALGELLKHHASSPASVHVQQLERIVRSAIQEVRREVSKLRGEEATLQEWRERWVRLCETFGKCTGTRVSAHIPDSLPRTDRSFGESVYRIIQEGLTNAYRHGSAENVDVVVGWEQGDGDIVLRISDDGRGSNGITIGNGLRGIQEGVSTLQGHVAFQTQPRKGFDIGIVIPRTGGQET